MFQTILNFWKFAHSPQLYRIYTLRNEIYEPNIFETAGNLAFSLWEVLRCTSYMTVPIFGSVVIRRIFTDNNAPYDIAWWVVYFGLFMAAGYTLRSFGRATNNVYVDFHKAYEQAIWNFSDDSKIIFQKYDFDYSGWIVEYVWTDCPQFDGKVGAVETTTLASTLRKIFSGPKSFIGFFVFRSFGISMMYPGSLRVFNLIIKTTLDDGRKQLMQRGGMRYKIRTQDNNDLDVMFVDKRSDKIKAREKIDDYFDQEFHKPDALNKKTDILVICTEGNAGFYEIGIMGSALETGHSVLGWNHPGFGYSTGVPYIDAERHAIDVIMQFAIEELEFAPRNIILYGWSIGGFASSFAASLYPEVKAVILDATFDDIFPLAENQMPRIVAGIVETTIRQYADLNVAQNLVKYPGSVFLFRRTHDEIIATRREDLSSNRGNYLLVKLLKFRYPNLFCNESEVSLLTWLSEGGEFFNGSDETGLNQEFSTTARTYPSVLGRNFDVVRKSKMLIFLAKKHLKDYDSTHCTPLPSSDFKAALDSLGVPTSP